MNQGIYKIRKYKPSDRKRILNLMQEFVEYYWPINPYKKDKIDSTKTAAYHTNKMVRQAFAKGGIIYVAEDDELVIGFVGIQLIKQSEEDAMEDIPMKLGLVDAIFVSKKYRGQGIGKELMEVSEGYFKENKCTHSTLNVHAYNTGPRKLYEELGYSDWQIEMIKTL